LTKAIIELAIKHTNNSHAFQSDLKSILNLQTRSKGRNRKYMKYSELLNGRFSIIKVGYVERSDDGNNRTINDLRDSGFKAGVENMRYE
jgi:hypothetical protein